MGGSWGKIGDVAKKDETSARREFLKRVLRTTVYAAPIVVAMSMSKASAQQPSWAPMGKGKGKGLDM